MLAEISPEHLIVIPQGELHLLPLHLIDSSPSDDDESYIMDRYEISYAPSMKILDICSDRTKRGEKKFFVVANPDHSLKFADNEVESISKHFTEKKELWYESAIKSAVYEQISWGSYIHFSCHGTAFTESFIQKDIMDAGLELANNERLRVADIFSQLRLPNAKYVTLSACETGIVKLDKGDEYLGLPGAFLFAGSIGIIASLWAVDDVSTSLLMEKFYEHMMVNKQRPVESFSQAQNWIRNLTSIELIRIFDNKINQLRIDKSKKEIVNTYIELRTRLGFDYKGSEKPYAEPYYWGGFFYSGLISLSPSPLPQ
jgi:CHAT domain-containing protein